MGYTTDGGGATSLFPTTMTIPADKYGPTTTWLLTVNGYNTPIGSSCTTPFSLIQKADIDIIQGL
jgi:hypothetical protein